MALTLRETVLQLFTEADTYLSGEDISHALGCTRTAVWKHISELRRLGYVFDAKPRKGYRLIERPDVLVPEEIKSFNRAQQIGQAIRYVDSTVSTQHMAHEWAQEGARHGSLVIADEQTGGKGRLGRMWYSPPGSGIWMSFILKPHLPLTHTPHLTLIFSVAVARALRKETAADVTIKWPNDIFVEGRKVCGILTEVRAEADRIHYAVAGVGINVHFHSEDLPQTIRTSAISLSEIVEKPLHRAQIVAACCGEIEDLLNVYERQSFSPIKSLWESYALMLGKQVTVHTAEGTRSGEAIGLDDRGALLLKTPSGIEHIFSADVDLNT